MSSFHFFSKTFAHIGQWIPLPRSIRQRQLDREAQEIYDCLRARKLTAEERPFFLYLRSFGAESTANHHWTISPSNRPRRRQTATMTTTEALADLLSDFGPLVYVKNPIREGETLWGLGGVRLAASSDFWLQEVTHLIVHCNAIFVRPHDTPGILSEFSAIVKDDYINQKTFIVMDPDSDYLGLRGLEEQIRLRLMIEDEISQRSTSLRSVLGRGKFGSSVDILRRTEERQRTLLELRSRAAALKMPDSIDPDDQDVVRRLAAKSAEWQETRRTLQKYGHDLPPPHAEGGIFSFHDINLSIPLHEFDRRKLAGLMMKLSVLMTGGIGSEVVRSEDDCPCGSTCDGNRLKFCDCHGLVFSNRKS